MIITTYIHQLPPSMGEGLLLALFQGEGSVGSMEAVEQKLHQLDLSARNEVTLLIADCMPAGCGPTQPEGRNYLQDRRPEIY